MVCVTMHACLRVLLVSWVVAILVDDVAALAQQSPARQSTTALRDPVSGRHRRHRSDKAKLLRNFLKKNGRLEGMIRLVDGPHAHIGNVEIYHQGKWGSVCDDEWDSREASVVCRELGFIGAVRETHNSLYGPARHAFWMDNVYCAGGEANLTDCRFDGWGVNDCQESEAAGVICQTGPVPYNAQLLQSSSRTTSSRPATTSIAAPTTTSANLVTSPDPSPGSTTINPILRLPNGTSNIPRPPPAIVRAPGTNRNTSFITSFIPRPPPAIVRAPGVSTSTTTASTRATSTTIPTTTTTTLAPTTTRTRTTLPTKSTTEEPKSGVKKPQHDMPSRSRLKDSLGEKVKIRLRGGRTKEEGRVEVKIGDNNWGLICGDGWSLYEAGVVCRELGFGFGQHAIQTDFFGGNRTAIALSGIQCHGSERSLSDCLHDRFGKVNCPGKENNIAAVVCASEMADLVPDHLELARSAHLEDRQLFFLQCAMEENCLSSSAYQVKKDDPYGWHLETRRLLRFTARIANIGTADFKPFIPKHMWQWHACHMHYHSMEVFAHFDIIDSSGKKVAEGHKASFCLEDNQCANNQEPVFKCANYGDQGISVNCSDTYAYNIDCQWVDITDIDPGFYTFKVVINPEFKVAEQTFDNNAAVCTLYYTPQFASVYNCVLQRP